MTLRNLLRKAARRWRFDPTRARFHFIHIPKNAGVAVRSALYLERDVSLSSPYHFRYVDVSDGLGEHLRYFAIVRNPWSRTASRFLFGKQVASKWSTDDPRRMFIAEASFDTFVRERRILEIPKHPGRPWMGPLSSWMNQLEWIRDKNGVVRCDCLRMEHLETDLSLYLGRQIRLERTNVTRNPYDFRRMYTDELAEIVGQVFREDIEHFGFSFDGPATCNVFGIH